MHVCGFKKYAEIEEMAQATWKYLAILLLFMMVITDVVLRLLMAHGYTAIELVIYSFIGALVCSVMYLLVTGAQMKTPKSGKEYALLIVLGVLFFAGFLVLREAQLQAPNIGLVSAISYSSAAFSILIMHYAFGDRVSWQAYVGAFLVVLGIFVAMQK